MQMLVAALPVAETHVSVTGLSMGGLGSWDMINRYPTLFAAAAPIAGAGNVSDAYNLVNGTGLTYLLTTFWQWLYEQKQI